MDRQIKYIVLHCTATDQYLDPQQIIDYWRNHLGWRNPGYHYLVEPSGRLHVLQPEELVANGVRGYNRQSIHVAFIGGINEHRQPEDNRTEAQKLVLRALVQTLKNRYPEATVQGHRDFPRVTKACPSFDANPEYAGI